jgi:hypothetical protein
MVSLTLEELAEYRKNNPEVEAFPWQKESEEKTDEVDTKPSDNLDGGGSIGGVSTSVIVEREIVNNEQKGLYDFLADGQDAMVEFNKLIVLLNDENVRIGTKLKKHTDNIQKVQNSGADVPNMMRRALSLAASDIKQSSKRFAQILPELEKNVESLDTNFTGFVTYVDTNIQENAEALRELHSTLSMVLQHARGAKDSMIGFRDNALDLASRNLSSDLTSANQLLAQTLTKVVSNLDEFESFCLRILFLIDEKLGGLPPPRQ